MGGLFAFCWSPLLILRYHFKQAGEQNTISPCFKVDGGVSAFHKAALWCFSFISFSFSGAGISFIYRADLVSGKQEKDGKETRTERKCVQYDSFSRSSPFRMNGFFLEVMSRGESTRPTRGGLGIAGTEKPSRMLVLFRSLGNITGYPAALVNLANVKCKRAT